MDLVPRGGVAISEMCPSHQCGTVCAALVPPDTSWHNGSSEGEGHKAGGVVLRDQHA
jgi:hypothetical protein